MMTGPLPTSLTIPHQIVTMPDRPILQGDLSKIQLPDVLSFVAMIRESGKLVLTREDLERNIHWASGELVFAKVPGAAPDFRALELNEAEIAIYQDIDGIRNVRELTGRSDLTQFEVARILFQLLSARLIEALPEEKSFRPVFLDVEDSPELLKIISTYNDMFGRLFETLEKSVGEGQAREIFMSILQSAETDELWAGVFFDQYGRFDENMLIANISELPFERRKAVLDEGLNTLLSVQLFEVSQHLDAAGKVDVFRFISDQKAALERVTAGIES